MDSSYKIYLQRAENELILAQVIFKVSNEKDMKESIFKINGEETFYSAVISHCYYSIFYSAKSYLLFKGIKTKAPEEHKKTYEEFRKISQSGELDMELLKLYENLLVKAEELLGIFKIERRKRGKFTYQTLHQANLDPAKESLRNSSSFFKQIFNMLE